MEGGQLRSAVAFGNVARVRAVLQACATTAAGGGGGGGRSAPSALVSALDKHRRNALHIACEREFIDEGARVEMFRLLLQAAAAAADPDAVVNASDMMGFTPLHLLCANAVGGTERAVTVLLESGANPCAVTDGGRRPRDFTRRADVKATLAVAEEGRGQGRGDRQVARVSDKGAAGSAKNVGPRGECG